MDSDYSPVFSTKTEHNNRNTSLRQFLEDTEIFMDHAHPGWDDGRTNENTICIPYCADLYKKVVGPTDPNASRYRLAQEDIGKGIARNEQGEDAEARVLKMFRSANIGGIVIANFERLRFWKQLSKKAEPELQTVLQGIRDATSNPTKSKPEEYECDFLFLHPLSGIFLIEVKTTNGKRQKQKTALYTTARKQVEQFDDRMGRLVAHIAKAMKHEASEIVIGGAVICFPDSDIRNNVAPNSKAYNMDSSHMTTEKFAQFWLGILNQQPSGINLFKRPTFRDFVFALIGYRSVVYMSAAQNAIAISRAIFEQKIDPLLGNASKNVNDKEVCHGLAVALKMQPTDTNEVHIFHLTAEQLEVVECKERLQLIYGAPGTGKTLIVMLKMLEAAKTEKPGSRVVVRTWETFIPKLQALVKAHKDEIVRMPMIGSKGKILPNDDVIRDEMGLNAQDFLLWRASSECEGGSTVCVMTGNTSAADFGYVETVCDVLSTHAMFPYRTFEMTTIMRGSKKIVEQWKKELRNYKHVYMGHNFDGVEPLNLSFETVQETVKCIADKIHQLVYQERIDPKNIAVITPRKKETKILTSAIKSFLPWIQLCLAKEYVDNPRAVVVDEYVNVLSHEWPIVIMCSLRCDDLYETFELVAASRAIAYLIRIERNYRLIQDRYDKVFYETRNQNICLDLKTSNALLGHATKNLEDDVEVQLFHRILAVLRHNFIADDLSNQHPFEYCKNFVDCLDTIQQQPPLLRHFMNKLNYTRDTKGRISNRLNLNNDEKKKFDAKFEVVDTKFEIIILEHRKFLKYGLGIENEDESDLAQHYLRFMQTWCTEMTKLVEEGTFQHREQHLSEPEKQRLNNSPIFKLLFNAANFLVEHRCAVRFLPNLEKDVFSAVIINFPESPNKIDHETNAADRKLVVVKSCEAQKSKEITN